MLLFQIRVFLGKNMSNVTILNHAKKARNLSETSTIWMAYVI